VAKTGTSKTFRIGYNPWLHSRKNGADGKGATVRRPSKTGLEGRGRDRMGEIVKLDSLCVLMDSDAGPTLVA
jgi:hypothetical protein